MKNFILFYLMQKSPHYSKAEIKNLLLKDVVLYALTILTQTADKVFKKILNLNQIKNSVTLI